MNRSDAVLFVTTIIGSTTVILGELVLKTTPPFTVLAVRFLIAALILAFIRYKVIFPISKRAWIGGLCVGLTFGVGCTLLYLGLPHVRSGKANFLVSLEVVLVPLILFVWSRKIPLRREIVAIPIALLGLWLLTWGNGGGLSYYDMVILGSAFSYALYAISLSHFSPHASSTQITFVALATIGIITALITISLGNPILQIIDIRWFVIMGYLIIVGSIVRFILQSWAQKTASSTRAALIFALEPAMTTFMSCMFMGEVLSIRQCIGGALILTAAVITTVRFSNSVPH